MNRLVIVGVLLCVVVVGIVLAVLLWPSEATEPGAGPAVTVLAADANAGGTNTGVKNAAPLYLKAFDMFSSNLEEPPEVEYSELLPIVGEASLPPPGSPISEEMMEVIHQYVAANSESLRLLHEAGSIKTCDWPGDMDPVGGPFLANVRHSTRVLGLEMISFIGNGEIDKAAESVVSGFRLAESLGQFEDNVPLLVQFACDQILVNYLRYVLIAGTPLDDRLVELAGVLGAASNVRQPKAGLSSSGSLHPDLVASHSRVFAHVNVARTAILIERYRVRSGRLPASLSELVPDIAETLPGDPFGGDALIFMPLEPGYCVYSLGPDQDDDGGREWDREEEDGDIVFSVQR